jgi:predicted nucleic acid-binding protein
MGKMTLNLKNYNCISLDSAPFIYLIQEDPRYISVVEQIFSEISYGSITGVSSYLSLLEVLIKPIKEGARDIATQYRDLMLNNAFLKLLPLDDKVAETAAELRAKYDGNGFKLKTPDAIQIATAILNEADVFLTNDSRLKNVKEINVVVLSEII